MPTSAQPALRAYADETATCDRCALAAVRTQVVFGSGDPDAELMLVGEAPGFHEDQQGEPFVGQAGQLLDRLLAGIGLERSQRLSREHDQVPASGKSRPASGGDRRLRAASLPSGRARPARGRRDARELRHQAPLREAARHHTRARTGARGDARHAAGAALPALPPGSSALHTVDADGAGARLCADPGASRPLGRAAAASNTIPWRTSPSWSRSRPRRYSSGCSDPDMLALASSSAAETEALGGVLAGGLVLGDVVLRLRGAGHRQDDPRARRRESPRRDGSGDQPDVHDRPPLSRPSRRVPPRPVPLSWSLGRRMGRSRALLRRRRGLRRVAGGRRRQRCRRPG